jgi:hypothetical protein
VSSGPKGQNHSMDKGKPGLIAAGVLFGLLALSALLFSVDLVFLGMVAGFTAIPGALVAWMAVADRYY